MAETCGAKKRKHYGGSGDNSENLWSSADGGELNPGDGGPGDVAGLVAAMRKEMEEMRRGMAKLEGGMKHLKERNEILETRLSCVEDENKRMDKSLAHHRNLIKNQKWENPAPRIPSSYWASNGYDEETAADLKTLVRKIRKGTSYMRVDGESGVIGIAKNNDERVVPYDNILLPQWKEFANALRQYRHFTNQFPETVGPRCPETVGPGCPETIVPRLTIACAQLPRKILNLFEEALADTHFKKISFGFNNAGRDMASFLLNVTKSNPKLEALRSDSNPIEHVQDFEALVDAISAHPSLRTLSLQGSCRELGYNTLTSLFSSARQLEDINLSNNGISTLGNTFLERYLGENTCLEFLYLRDNNLDDFDAESIARGLKTNDKLIFLDIGGNDITEHGKEALLWTVFDSTTLHSAALSNHSCAVKCDDEWLEEINNNFDNTLNRSQKLYSILSSRNKESSNVVQLGQSVAREHIPAILDVVQKYAVAPAPLPDGFEAVQPLSIVYEILRGWDMPVLYENV